MAYKLSNDSTNSTPKSPAHFPKTPSSLSGVRPKRGGNVTAHPCHGYDKTCGEQVWKDVEEPGRAWHGVGALGKVLEA